MPHIVIEYSSGLEERYSINELITVAVRAAADSDVMDQRDIKARAIPYHHYQLGDGGGTFLHVTVRVLAGRAPEEKLRLSSVLRERIAAFAPLIHSISIEISEMDPACYRKRLLRDS